MADQHVNHEDQSEDEWQPLNSQEVRPPSPDEIELECAKIRADWSESEFKKRAGIRTTVRWVVPEVRVADWQE